MTMVVAVDVDRSWDWCVFVVGIGSTIGGDDDRGDVSGRRWVAGVGGGSIHDVMLSECCCHPDDDGELYADY